MNIQTVLAGVAVTFPGDYLSVYHVGYMEDNKLVIHKATFDENGKIDEEWEMKDGDSETMLSFEEIFP